jgi:hypothetical protein
MSPASTYRFTDERYIKSRVIEHNLFYGIHPATEPEDPYKITGDPMLAGPGSGSTGLETTGGYRLTSGSAAVNKGMDIPDNGGYDYWGNPLYYGKPDIGAHELQVPSGMEIRSRDPRKSPLLDICPNPLVDRVTITFQLQEDGFVTMDILDSMGRKVDSLIGERLDAGEYRYVWRGTGPDNRLLENGIYICHLRIHDLLTGMQLNKEICRVRGKGASRAIFIQR